jgi:transposase
MSWGVPDRRGVNRLHRLLLELLPGGAKKFLSATQARALLASVRPRDVLGKTRRRLAANLITELALIDKRIKAANVELRDLITATGSSLLELPGIGPSSAARLLGDVGEIAGFADKGRFTSWNGTAPIDASSGDQRRHRLSRAGNRRINRVLHIMAIVALRNDTEGRAYYRRKLAAGKTTMEAMRCLKRRLSDIVYRQMVNDAKRPAASPGGHVGATTHSSAADPIPAASTSDQSLPGPAKDDLTPVTTSTPAHSSPRSRRPRSTPDRSRRPAHSA